LNTKLILQVAVTSLVLIAGSGLLCTGIGIAETFDQLSSSQPEPRHTTRQGAHDDFIFAPNYTWLGSN
jgi:hypothetical protein